MLGCRVLTRHLGLLSRLSECRTLVTPHLATQPTLNRVDSLDIHKLVDSTPFPLVLEGPIPQVLEGPIPQVGAGPTRVVPTPSNKLEAIPKDLIRLVGVLIQRLQAVTLHLQVTSQGGELVALDIHLNQQVRVALALPLVTEPLVTEPLAMEEPLSPLDKTTQVVLLLQVL
ncbi:hypothetical protein scyTo_0021029 [Scyliorhinus torazame]|uniref:Uncharacterized protein n=1 Tax=Scyliorhinus torazame TaxID=75743 RepID=A0A401PUN5_SCYTO|nr:hypothetical protein [Scyliorhinus torazame]